MAHELIQCHNWVYVLDVDHSGSHDQYCTGLLRSIARQQQQTSMDTVAPLDEQEYEVKIGDSIYEDPSSSDAKSIETKNVNQKSAFCTLRYDFQPASVDSTVPGLITVDNSDRTHILMANSSGTPNGVSFKGKMNPSKDVDCLLFFDGTSFRLERCEFAFTQLRHVRTSGPMTSQPILPVKDSDLKRKLSKGTKRSTRSSTLQNQRKRKTTAEMDIAAKVTQSSNEASFGKTEGKTTPMQHKRLKES